MSEAENNAPPSKPPSSGDHGVLWFILILVLLVLAGLYAAVYWPPVRDRLATVADMSQTPQGKIEDIEHKIQALDARVSALETRVETIASAPSPTSAPTPAHTSAADLAHVQSDLTELATTVGGLQNQVKQSGDAAHGLAQGALAKMIAYMQLRDDAASGRGFVKPLDALRAATKTDSGLKEPLDALAPYAEKGAPDSASLRAQLEEQTAATEVATAKAAAQTWWERILAEFRGLVLIRSMHQTDTQGAALTAMKTALEQNDLSAALDDMKTLPPDAQKVLEDWRKKAEARQAIDGALRMIADRLAGGSDAAVAPSGQGKDEP